jgi:phthiocerol/phenolphthiocerol synthesis type-I polyketide synthase C
VKWLVRRGARYLVLIGRRGPGNECDAELAEYTRRGVRFVCEPCDVADAAAIEALLKRIRVTMPPLAGVMHAAMVIEDALVGSLNRDQLSRVLAPKVTGADNLDRLTRVDNLHYFVLFSSVTSMLGNPGQGSYVAANAYMEGLARRRRQEGRPALAVGWGPIADVGIVARSDKLKANLLDRHGMKGMVAAQALDLMGEALAVADRDDELAVVTFASQDWTLRATQLRVLRSPTHAALFGQSADGSERIATSVNLQELAGEGDPVALKRQVRSIIAGRLASVLHAREDGLDQNQPLFQMGLDSLMAFELSSSLEQALGVQVALDGSLVLLSIASLADKLIAQVGRKAEDSNTEIARSIAAKHISNVTEAQVEELAAFAKPVLEDSDPKRVLQ